MVHNPFVRCCNILNMDKWPPLLSVSHDWNLWVLVQSQDHAIYYKVKPHSSRITVNSGKPQSGNGKFRVCQWKNIFFCFSICFSVCSKWINARSLVDNSVLKSVNAAAGGKNVSFDTIFFA